VGWRAACRGLCPQRPIVTLSVAPLSPQLSTASLPTTTPGLLERYVGLRLRLLPPDDDAQTGAKLLSALAAAREPLGLAQAAQALQGVWRRRGSAVVPPADPAADPASAATGWGLAARLPQLACRALGCLLRVRRVGGAACGWRLGDELVLRHSAASEWLQPKARAFGGGAVVLDVSAGHRALASLCRDDALGCLDGGAWEGPGGADIQAKQEQRDSTGSVCCCRLRTAWLSFRPPGAALTGPEPAHGWCLPPHGYSLRHLFMHAGLAALAAVAAETEAEAAAVAPSPSGTAAGGAPSSVRSLRGATSTASAALRRASSRCGTGVCTARHGHWAPLPCRCA
jgi:hypothetical protein